MMLTLLFISPRSIGQLLQIRKLDRSDVGVTLGFNFLFPSPVRRGSCL